MNNEYQKGGRDRSSNVFALRMTVMMALAGSTAPGVALARASVTTLLILTIVACSDSGKEEAASAEGASPAATTPEAARPVNDEPQIAGELVIDGQSHALTTVYWCEPEAGYESGTTITIRVAAMDASGDVVVYGRQIDREGRNSTSETFIRATTDHPQNYYNSDRDNREPTILIEGGVARIQGYVRRRGGDPIEVEAEFSLPAAPRFPTEC